MLDILVFLGFVRTRTPPDPPVWQTGSPAPAPPG